MSSFSALFLGSKSFGLTILQTLVAADPSVSWQVVHPDDSTDVRSAMPEFGSFCADMGIPFTVAGTPREANERIAADSPATVFVCGWYSLIPPELLASGSRFVGIHNSLLPKYRGGAPLVWAMINGETEVGSTLFRFTPGMDDGPIYLQVETHVEPDDRIGSVLERLEAALIEALPNAWRAIVSGIDQGREQDHNAATYCGQRIPADGRIDWRAPAKRVHDFIRAQSRPYPGAFAQADDRRIWLWRSEPVKSRYFGTPGQVLSRQASHVDIACGNGSGIRVFEATDSLGNHDLMTIFGSMRTRLG